MRRREPRVRKPPEVVRMRASSTVLVKASRRVNLLLAGIVVDSSPKAGSMRWMNSRRGVKSGQRLSIMSIVECRYNAGVCKPMVARSNFVPSRVNQMSN